MRAWLLPIALGLVPVGAWAAPKLEAARLGNGTAEVAHESPKAPRQTDKNQYKDSIAKASTEDEEQLADAIGSYGVLLKHMPPGAERQAMQLNRISARFSLGQAKVLKGDKATPNPEARKILMLAVAEAQALSRDAAVGREVRGKALHLAGLSYIYLDRADEAAARLREALALAPNLPDAPWMSFYVAENDFDAGRFKPALALYLNYLSDETRPLKQLAWYKAAWCYINLAQWKQAEDFFMKIIRESDGQDLGKDAIRDFAFIVTKFRKGDEILKQSARMFPDPRARLEFLRVVQANLESQGTSTMASPVLAFLLENEKEPIPRLKLLLGVLRSERRDYAARSHLQAFVRIKKALEADKLDKKSPELEPVMSSLDLETQKIIRAFVGTFAGRNRTPDQLTREDMARALKALFSFYQRNFPDSPLRSTIAGLWLDVCGEIKDYGCIATVGRDAIDDPKVKDVAVRAELDRLTALEELGKRDAAKYSDEFEQALERYVTNWGAAKPLPKQWPDIARRLAALRVKAGHHDKALPLLEKLVTVEPTSANFYLLQRNRYELKQYDAVLADPRVKQLPATPDLKEVLRESALALAVKARDKKDDGEYERQMRVFFAQNPDPAKLKIAQQDFVSFQMDKGALGEADHEMLAMPLDQRLSKDFQPALTRLLFLHLGRGEFAEVWKLLTQHPPALAATVAYPGLLARVGLIQKPDYAAIRAQSPEKQEYVLGLLVLFQPRNAIEYFTTVAPPKTDSERALLLTALRLEKNNWSFQANAREAALLGPALPASQVAHGLTPYEKAIARAVYPGSKLGPAKFTRLFQSLVALTRQARPQAASSAQGLPLAVQQRVFNAAKVHENRVAEVIAKSPFPAGLTPEQLQQYKQGLAKAAAEFSDQAGEFGKLAALAQEALDREDSAKKERVLPKPDMKRWPWPAGFDQTPARAQLDRGNVAGALLIADLLREDDGPLKKDEDYFRARAGILLQAREGETMRRYVFEELLTSRREDIIEVWKGITK